MSLACVKIINSPTNPIAKASIPKTTNKMLTNNIGRSANGISKTGYVHPNTHLRYGIECKLEEEVSPYEDMPDNIKVSQRQWYKGEYKEY